MGGIQSFVQARPAFLAAAHLCQKIAPATHNFHVERGGLFALTDYRQRVLHGTERGAVAPLRRKNLCHAVRFLGNIDLIVDAAEGLNCLQIVGERCIELPQLGIDFSQIMQRLAKIGGNIELLA